MKKIIFYLLTILFCWNASGQGLYLSISSELGFENKIIDSVGFEKKHKVLKKLFEETNLLSDKLVKIGYLDTQVIQKSKLNDSTFVFDFRLGERTDFAHIYIGKNSELKTLGIFNSKNDTLIVPYGNLERFLNESLLKLEKNGFALSRLKFLNIERKRNKLVGEILLVADKKRGFNGIVINGYDKFPKGYEKNIRRKYKNVLFNKDNLKKINDDFNKMRFVKQTKFPEILFMTDSTKVYVYLEKSKLNNFDGLIGFSNDENEKTKINGYLDLKLINSLNTGERFELFWRNDGRNQKVFNVAVELPFVFRTAFVAKAGLNIFTQDSTFQNSKSEINLGYFLKFNTKAFVGYLESESNDIKNTYSNNLTDFKSSFVTSTLEINDFFKQTLNESIFDRENKFSLIFGLGNRKTKTAQDNQYFVNLNATCYFNVNKKNSFKIKTENYFLKSNNYKTNELYRFGGINSVRGFVENSLQANALAMVATEYQYLVSNSLYLHSVVDYGFYEDRTNSSKNNLLGLGFGFGLLTKNGILNFIYANGSTNSESIKSSNSIIQLNLKANF